jgi:hypothetical protein
VRRTRSGAGAGYGIVLVGMLLGAVLSLGGVALARSGADGPPCTPLAAHPGWSVARQWNEALLDAIRRDLPDPTVHARNLFHTAVAMWDAWAAYDPTASGYLVDEDHDARRRRGCPRGGDQLRRLPGAQPPLPRLGRRVRHVAGLRRGHGGRCLPLDVTTTQGSSPAAVGNRIAARVLEVGLADGANEEGGTSHRRATRPSTHRSRSPPPARR